VVKSRKIRWAGCVACIGKRRNAFAGLCLENTKKSDHFEVMGYVGGIILK
jgi:hypothetical protein